MKKIIVRDDVNTYHRVRRKLENSEFVVMSEDVPKTLDDRRYVINSNMRIITRIIYSVFSVENRSLIKLK